MVVGNVNFFAGIIFGRFLHRCEKNWIVISARANFVVPFLYKNYTCFSAGMRLENISMQADNRQNSAAFGKKITNIFITGIIKTTLRQNYSHTPAGFQKLQITFNEKNISPHFRLIFYFNFSDFIFFDIFFCQVIFVQDTAFFYISGKRRIRHNNIKIKIAIFIFNGAKFSQLFPALVINVSPILIRSIFVPTFIIQSIQPKYICVAVPCN